MDIEKLIFTKNGKKYIVFNSEGLFCSEEGVSFQSKEIKIPWNSIEKISLGAVGGRAVVDAELKIYTNIPIAESKKTERSATLQFENIIHENIIYIVSIVDIDNLPWIEVVKKMRSALSTYNIKHEGMDDEHIQDMLDSANLYKRSIFIFTGIVIGLLVIAKILN